MSNERLSPENIKSRIDYIKTKSIKETQETIEFYKSVGANADLTRYEDEVSEFERDIINLESLLSGEVKKLDTIKVKIVEYNGNIIVETINPNDFDEDYLAVGQGRYACMLLNNSRLAISNEAAELIKSMGKTRDVLGAFVGDESHFAWCGDVYSVFSSEDKVCRDFKMPSGYKTIENEVAQEAKGFIDDKKSGVENVEFSDVEHDLWIELRQGNDYDHETKVRTYEDNYKVNVIIQKSYIHDPEIEVLNAPKGSVYNDYDNSRVIKMNQENHDEIISLANNIFVEENAIEDIELEGSIKELWGKIKREGSVHENDIMSYVNGLYNSGLSNNIMNPHKDYWRMSIRATGEEIIKALKEFKRV